MIKTLQTYSDIDPFPSPIFNGYFSRCKVCALDIETTGLNPNKDCILLVGILLFHQTEVELIQLFAESLEEETELLSHLLSIVEKYHVVLNYNGSSFDIPFILKRCRLHNLDGEHALPSYKSFDLYRLARKSYLPEILPDLKLKTVEKLVGILRSDTISGKESISLYEQYLCTKSSVFKEKILLHNAEDLLCFPKLMLIFNKIDAHQALYHLGFPVISKNFTFYIRKIQVKENRLIAGGVTDQTKSSAAYYEPAFSLLIDEHADTFALQIFLDSPQSKEELTPYFLNQLIIATLKDI